MKNIKKLNLLPPEIKTKYANKYMLSIAGVIGAFLIAILFLQYTQIGILSWQINTIEENNHKYENEELAIEVLKKDIERYDRILAEYENRNFPFSQFLNDLTLYKPYDVRIISVDSEERLINEGEQDVNSVELLPEESIEIDENEQNNETEETEQNTKDPIQQPEGKIEYTSDLKDRTIIIRGYGANQSSISDFIYTITHFPYVKDAQITAIEEHEIEGGIYNIFELRIKGGA
jgi:hypothetical protein